MHKRDEQTPSRKPTPQPPGDDLGNPQDERQRTPRRKPESEEMDEELE